MTVMNYEQVDLNRLELFDFYSQESNKPKVIFAFFKNDNVVEILDDDDKFKLPFFSNIVINRYSKLLDNNHSIAVNSGYLKVEDLKNYSYVGLLEIEVNVLLKSAEKVNKMVHRYSPDGEFERKRAKIIKDEETSMAYQEIMSNQKNYYIEVSKLAQKLVDRFYEKILNHSALL